ncbi:MAG: chromate transporter [Parasporobacterium sp.]|nr:chromate transporter [Parasporobacterium sp.]
MNLLIMCLEFMKTGLFAVGGGLATIPFLYEMAVRYPWFTSQDVLTYIAIAESTPGPIGINMATYAGYTSFGWFGGILATLSLALPSFVVILIVAGMLDKFRTNRFVLGGFKMLRPASTGLIAAAGFNVILTVFFGVEKITFSMLGRIGEIFTQVNWLAMIMFAVLFAAMRYFRKIHPIFFILASAGLGILLKL